MKYDLVVIGAGIQGAGVAQAAAAAGYSVLVVEKAAPAAGTSSKSSKLIHGGLRYLETGQFSLVRESLRERELLLRLAPELVKLKPLHVPVYEDSTRSPRTIRAGLSLYALLANLNRQSLFTRLERSEWHSLAGLRQEKLIAVFRYREAQTDDAALTRAVLYSASILGADIRMPAQFISAERNGQCCKVEIETEGRREAVSCRVLVNCAGPWARDILQHIHPAVRLPNVDLVQGSHLVLPPLLNQLFYLEAPADKRAVFALPWNKRLLVGTTETIYEGRPENVNCTPAERDYLLSTLQYYFPELSIPTNDIDSFAGLRVLPKSEKRAFARSRDVMLSVDNEARPRVLSVMGGKLTTYRATAERVMDRLAPSLPTKERRAHTELISLIPVN